MLKNLVLDKGDYAMNKFSFPKIRRILSQLILRPRSEYVTINLNQYHIDKGERYDSINCPIALAVKDVFPDATVYVFKHGVIYVDKGGLLIYDSNDYNKLGDFIRDFDNGMLVEPLEFKLVIYAPTVFA